MIWTVLTICAGIVFVSSLAFIAFVVYSCCVISGYCSREEER